MRAAGQDVIEFSKQAVESSLPARFETLARELADQPAISSDEASWSYAELNAEANRLARRLLRDGPCEGATLLLLGHGVHEIAGMLASLKAGSAYVALDPGVPPARLQAIARDLGAERIISHERHRDIATELAGDVIEIEAIDRDLSAADLGLAIPAESLATVVYTSGSTGDPKGVMRSHRCVLHRSWLFRASQEVGPGDRVAHMFSCSFAASEVDVWGALLNGATLCIYPTHSLGIGPLADWLLREGISLLHPPPTLFRRFLDGLDQPLEGSSLRILSLAGEPVHRSDLERIRRLLPGCSVQHRFSTTETSVLTRLILEADTPMEEATLPAGLPVEDKQIRLVDAAGAEVAAGEIGEIEVRSRYLADGYWGRPDLTRERFRTDADGVTRVIRTGDLGRWRSDGVLQHLGRADRQLKIRGYRVEPDEVECALLELESVKEAAVVAGTGERGEARLVGWVVPARPDAVDARDLRRQLAEKVPRYMIPAVIAFAEGLPTTSTGKIDRKALAEGEPEGPLTPLPRSAPDAPDGIEFQVRLLWQDVMSRRDIGIHDDFFDLGGDSILAADLMLRVERLFGETPILADFVAEPTIAAMARQLRGKRPTRSHRYLVPMRTGAGGPPFFCVHADTGSAMHFVSLARHLDPDQPFYAIQARGMDGCGVPHARIEEMATDYLVEVRRLQPHGPYYLGGRCLGGLIAAEMARQLLAAGEEIAIVAVFDASGPRVARMLKRAKLRWRDFRRQLNGSGKVSATAPDRPFRSHLKRARKRYRPKPYPGKITLFLAGNDQEKMLQGWRDFAGGRTEMEPVPGDHNSILREPNVEILARRLEEHLARARRQAEGASQGR